MIKNNFLKKIIAFDIIICCILSIGCGKEDKGDTAKKIYNKAAKSSDIHDGTIQNDAVMLSVGDIDITYGEVMLYLLSLKNEYETMFSSNVWNYSFDANSDNEASYESLAKENIIKQLTMQKVLQQISKDSLDIQLNNAEKIEARDSAKEYVDKIDEKVKKKYDISEDIVKTYFEDNYIATKVYDYITCDAKSVSEEDARVVRVKQIGVIFDGETKNGNVIEKSDESMEEAKTRIENIKQRIQPNVASFTKMAVDESDCKDIEVLVKKGEQSSEYEKIAYSLKQDEISDVFETDKGFFILYCVVEDDIHETKNNMEEKNEDNKNDMFAKQYSEWLKNYDVYVVSELWKRISFEKL